MDINATYRCYSVSHALLRNKNEDYDAAHVGEDSGHDDDVDDDDDEGG